MNLKNYFVLSVVAGLMMTTTVNEISAKDKFEPTWESLKTAEPAEWWRDAKFGIFIHWGPYSVAGYKLGGRGYAEAITNDMYARPEEYSEFFKKKFGEQPEGFGYKDWIPMYTASEWDPQAWAKLFKDAGAKYVIPTAEHHDGFANWDSDLTDWCATKMGPMRDLVGDLGEAVRAEGLNYGLSYHRERHPNRYAKGFEVYAKPYAGVLREIELTPDAMGLYGPFEYSDEFIADYVARWQELQEKYSPDFLWMDDAPILYHHSGEPQVVKFETAFKEMIADYLNDAEEKGKEVYFNNKGKALNFPEGVGCVERDNLQMNEVGPCWQNPATLGVSYAYMENEDLNDIYRTPAELIRLLVDVVSKNGNLLLNIGPRADGTIPEGMQRRLLEMGRWLKINGEVIYGTRPWTTFGESYGELVVNKNDVNPKHSIPIREQEYRFTTKGENIYVTSFQEDEKIVLKSFADNVVKIKSVKDIYGKSVKWELNDSALVIYPNNDREFFIATTYVVKTK